jgi:hypothetical protein
VSALRTGLLVTIVALMLSACAAEQRDERPPKEVWYETRLDFLTNHPYEMTCGDERHVKRFGKRTYFALADIERFHDMSRLRAATSIFYAVQELCQGKSDGYKPIPLAVQDVRAGIYMSTQGNAGNDSDHGVNRRYKGEDSPAPGTIRAHAGT